MDSTVGDASGDASAADATDSGADGGSTQLEWCPSLDVTFGLVAADAGADAGICATETPANGTCPDRAGSGWAHPLIGIPGDFLNLLYADCRIEAMGSIPALGTTEVTDYGNQVVLWTLAFFGCPQPATAVGPFNGFGLIPTPLSGHAFTTADVQLLEDMYLAAIAQALSDNGSPALTATQTAEVQASLTAWASSVSPVASPVYSYADTSTCAPDGGAIGSDAGTDGESDGGTEGSTDAGGG